MMSDVFREALPLRVLALMDTYRVSGPCLGLFELIEQIPNGGPQVVVGIFLRDPNSSSPACEEASRRGIHLTVFREKYRYDPRPILQAMRVVKKHNISLLQSHGYKSGAVAWVLKRLTGLPWVAFVHGYTAENGRMAMYNRLDRWIMRGADRVIAVSEATRRLLQKAGVPECRVRVIHNGVDLQRRSAGAESKKLRRLWQRAPDSLLVGVIGRLSPEKGQAVFLDAFRIVAQALPNAKAVLVGEGPERSALEASVKAAGLEQYVQFAGYQTDMSSIYNALDLVVIPSLSEGLPNVLLEAFLHEKAVIATAVGGIPEVMQNGLSKFLVPAGDAKGLADAIVEVLRDPILRKELGEAGARRVREAFSLSQRTQRITDLYNELLATP
jgi:glycosyltransferase involved in cell wall biosynthesis